MRKDFDRRWQELSAEVLTGMKGWRLQHPRLPGYSKATLSSACICITMVL